MLTSDRCWGAFILLTILVFIEGSLGVFGVFGTGQLSSVLFKQTCIMEGIAFVCLGAAVYCEIKELKNL